MRILMIPEDPFEPDEDLMNLLHNYGHLPLTRSEAMLKPTSTKRSKQPKTMPNFITAS